MSDSVYFGGESPNIPHLGNKGEIGDVRGDVNRALGAMEAGGLFRVDDFTNPPAADADAFLATEATVTEASVLRAADLIADSIVGGPRAITVSLGDDAGAYSTDDIVIEGTAYGEKVVLTFTPSGADGNETLESNEDWGLDTITKVSIPAQADTDGDISIGFGAELVLFRGIRDMAGISTPIREVAVGAVVTTGTFSGRKYTTAAAPDGTRDFSVAYVASV